MSSFFSLLLMDVQRIPASAPHAVSCFHALSWVN